MEMHALLASVCMRLVWSYDIGSLPKLNMALSMPFLQAVAYEFNTEFSRVLSQRMTFFSNDPSADTINRVKGEILQVSTSVRWTAMKGCVHCCNV